MSILVTYHSRTGNTRKVAEAIHRALGGETVLLALDARADVERYDLIFIGFPIHESGPSPEAETFIRSLPKGKRIALFVTQAAPTDAPIASRQVDRCGQAAIDKELLGIYACRGELSEETARRMAASSNKMLRAFGSMRDQTLGHPDIAEIEGAVRFAWALASPKHCRLNTDASTPANV